MRFLRIKYQKLILINFGKKSCISLDFIDGGDVYSSLSNLKDQKFSGLLKKSKNPLFIIGQGPLISKDGESLFYFLLDLYNKNSKNQKWSGFNILQNYSGRVGALDLNFYNKKNVNKMYVNNIYNGKYDIL